MADVTNALLYNASTWSCSCCHSSTLKLLQESLIGGSLLAPLGGGVGGEVIRFYKRFLMSESPNSLNFLPCHIASPLLPFPGPSFSTTSSPSTLFSSSRPCVTPPLLSSRFSVPLVPSLASSYLFCVPLCA